MKTIEEIIDSENAKLYNQLKFKNDQKLLGYTNPQMAQFLGVCISYVEHMRGGRRKVSPAIAKKIDDALKRESNSYNYI